jgi:hypothetical protein
MRLTVLFIVAVGGWDSGVFHKHMPLYCHVLEPGQQTLTAVVMNFWVKF